MGTSDYEHSHPLPRAVADTIFLIFEDLSDEDLLKRCLHGGTQNQNEDINALIWQRATKETHSGLNTVELAVFLAVSHFNDGAGSIILVLEECTVRTPTQNLTMTDCAVLAERAVSIHRREGDK